MGTEAKEYKELAKAFCNAVAARLPRASARNPHTECSHMLSTWHPPWYFSLLPTDVLGGGFRIAFLIPKWVLI